MVDPLHDDAALDTFADWERASWEQRARAYAASFGQLTGGSVDALLDAADVGAGRRMLDVGCGPGFVALAAVARGADVIAVDQSQEMVGLARVAGLRAEQAGAERLPFPDDRFDAVVAGYLLNHLARPEAAVTEFARVLRPGGRLALTVWDEPGLNRAIGSISDVVTAAGLVDGSPPGPESTRFADEQRARTLLDGWTDVTVRRPSWTVEVEPGRWFDAIADATPRTGAAVAQADADTRVRVRERYVASVVADTTAEGRVSLTAAAVLIGATRPDAPHA